jgi:hypothetical protein
MAELDARIERIELNQDSGWYRISLDSDRIKTLDTKKADLAEQAAEFKRSGAVARITFTERDSQRVNPHTNRPFINRYYEGAVPVTPATAVGSGIDVVTKEQQAAPRGEDKTIAWRICLAAGGKLAVATLPMMKVTERDFETQKRIAEEWAEFFFFSPVPSEPSRNGGNPSLFQAPAGSLPAFTGPGSYVDPGSDAPPPSDDDIPF